MLPAIFRTVRLVLRPIAPEDAGPIFDSYAGDLEVTRLLTWLLPDMATHQNRGGTDGYIAGCIATPPDIACT